MDPRIGKMIFFGAIFRCLEPTLTIAASLAFRSPFFSPFDKRDEADAVKKRFDGTSDHMTLLKAFRGWTHSKTEGRRAERDYLRGNFLSFNTLRMIDKMKNQFKQLLREIGICEAEGDAARDAAAAAAKSDQVDATRNAAARVLLVVSKSSPVFVRSLGAHLLA